MNQPCRGLRKVYASETTLSAYLANMVDDLTRLFNKVPVMPNSERKRLSDKFSCTAIAMMRNERITYGQASNAPEFLNQDYESFRAFIKKVDQNLEWQCETVAAAFDRYQKTGEIPAPHYPMRIAILLRKAKDFNRERQFLVAWCNHFPSGNGVKYGTLMERAKKAGAIQPSD